MSVVNDPKKAHIQMTDGSGLDVVLNGERMSFRDSYEKATAVEAEYGDGVLVVHVDWESGLSVEAAHLNEAETEEWAVIPCVLEYEDDDGDRKQFLSNDERYAFELELVRIYPDEPEVATDGGLETLTLRVGSARTVAYGPAGATSGEWALRFTAEDGERVSVRLDEEAMYELWTEVHNVPWPSREDDRHDLQREIVARAETAGPETLREALDVLGGDER